MNRDTANELLKKAVNEIKESDEGKIELNGKMYSQVARRIEIFRKYFGFDGRLNSEILEATQESIIVKATVEVCIDNEYIQVGMGSSQKFRNHSQMEMNSGLEMCETAAIGRALSNIGVMGGEFASINEIKDKEETGAKNEEKTTKKTTTRAKKTAATKEDGITAEQMRVIMKIKDLDKYLTSYGVVKASELTKVQASDIIQQDKGEITL